MSKKQETQREYASLVARVLKGIEAMKAFNAYVGPDKFGGQDIMVLNPDYARLKIHKEYLRRIAEIK